MLFVQRLRYVHLCLSSSIHSADKMCNRKRVIGNQYLFYLLPLMQLLNSDCCDIIVNKDKNRRTLDKISIVLREFFP